MQKHYIEMENCTICPNNCCTNRYESEDGICRSGAEIKIASYGPHYGEEPEITGWSSSGTIFLSGCNLLCNFCQNYDISHMGEGRAFSEEGVAEIMLKIQDYGSSNINLVTPTHFSPQLIEAVKIAKAGGLKLPIVYNSNAYEKTETLKQWDGLVDIYMPDLKFKDSKKSSKYTIAPDYFEYASKAIIEMHRQTGDLEIINETARKGLLIRHLIMPNNQSDTKEIIDFVADNIGPQTYLNLMEQYRPCYKADKYPEINRRINEEEYREAVTYAKDRGFFRPDYIFEG